MTVIIRPFNWIGRAGGGIAAVTQFTPDLSAGTGQILPIIQWIQAAHWYTAATTDPFQMRNDVVNQCNCRRMAGTGNNPIDCIFYPIPLINTAVIGKPQFAQGRFLSRSNVNPNNVGPAVMVSGDASVQLRGYVAYTNAPDPFNTVFVERMNQQNTGLTIITQAGFAVNDMIRLECTPSAASNEVRLFQNGVQVASFTDNNAVRAPFGTGIPAWDMKAIAIPINSESVWSQLSFGIL